MLVIVGESGAGKTATESYLVEEKGMVKTVSLASRTPRVGDVEGLDYHFVTREYINKLKDEGKLGEYVEYKGNVYAIRKEDCRNDRVVVVEKEGLRQLKDHQDLDIRAVYLRVSEKERGLRMERRGDSTEYAKDRVEYDKKAFEGISEMVDLEIETDNMSIAEVGEKVYAWYIKESV